MLLADVWGWKDWTALAAVPALVALNAFFVIAEFALVAVRSTRIEELVKQNARGAHAAAAAIANINQVIAAAQLGITLASIALGWVGEPFLARFLEPFLGMIPMEWRGITAHTAATILAFAAITYLHVVFGEQLPKTIAMQQPDWHARWSAGPLNLFVRATRPIIVFMTVTGNWFLRLAGYRASAGDSEVHTVDELRLLIEDTEEAGILDAEQAELVQNVFELSDKTVRSIMVPREKMAALERTMSPDQVMTAVRAGAHTRMPVYESDPNAIVGIVNTKDLFYLFSLSGVVVLDDAIYPATYLDPEETVSNALRLFRKSRRPMALVRDAAGTIHGLLTLEDVLEEIVGDLEDEHDRPVPKLRPRGKRRPR